MSRTYRRKIGSKNHYFHYFVTHELIGVESATGRKYFQWMPLDKDSKEYKKAMAIYHSDSGTFSFKEPGPSWFRKLFTERPQRRESDIKKTPLHRCNGVFRFNLALAYTSVGLERVANASGKVSHFS